MVDKDPDFPTPREEILTDARSTISETMSDLWWTYLVRGILALIVGIAALFWPTASISLLLRLVGLFLVIDGVVSFLGLRRRASSQSLAWIASLVIGALLLFLPSTSARIVFLLIGLWALVTGAAYLYTWWKMSDDDTERDSTRNSGIIACIAGIILVFWPGTGLVAIGWVIAIVAFVLAGISFFLASRLKRVRDRVDAKIIN